MALKIFPFTFSVLPQVTFHITIPITSCLDTLKPTNPPEAPKGIFQFSEIFSDSTDQGKTKGNHPNKSKTTVP